MLLTCAMSPEGGLGAVPNPLAVRHLGLTASQEVGGLRNAAVTRALRPRTALTVVKYHAWCGSGGFHGDSRVTKTSLGDTRYRQALFISSILEGINTMFWRSDCGGGDESEWNLAKSAAIVRDAKPESDVHSILPKQRSPLENTGFKV